MVCCCFSESCTDWSQLPLWQNQHTWYACGKICPLSSLSFHLCLPFCLPRLPSLQLFFFPIPEKVVHFNSAGRHIPHQPWWASGPQQQRLKDLFLSTWLFSNVNHCCIVLSCFSFFYWFLVFPSHSHTCPIWRYPNVLFSSSSLSALCIKIRLPGFYHSLSWKLAAPLPQSRFYRVILFSLFSSLSRCFALHGCNTIIPKSHPFFIKSHWKQLCEG